MSSSPTHDNATNLPEPSAALTKYHERCDEADARCRRYTEKFLDGEITEHELRSQILAEVTTLRVIQSVVKPSYTPSWREEAVGRLQDILVRRFMEVDRDIPAEIDPATDKPVIDPKTGKPAEPTTVKAFFDPVRALYNMSTYVGAARQLCAVSLPTVNRDITSSRRRFGSTMSESETENGNHGESAADAVESAEETTISLLNLGLNNDATDQILTMTKALRTGNQREVATRAMLRMYGLPDLIRLPVGDRRVLLELLDEDRTLARRSITYLHDLHTLGKSRAPRPNEAMLALWDDYSLADIEHLLELTPRIAEAAVIDAISDRARPSRSVIREFTRSVVQSGSGRGWRSAAGALARVYIAAECEAIASCDSTKADTDAINQRLAGREMVIATEDQVFNQLFSEHPDTDFGRDRDSVKAKLSNLLDRCTRLEEILVAGLDTLKVEPDAA